MILLIDPELQANYFRQMYREEIECWGPSSNRILYYDTDGILVGTQMVYHYDVFDEETGAHIESYDEYGDVRITDDYKEHFNL